MGDLNLVPENYDAFTQQSYWDSFFVERGDEAFEWYGCLTDFLVIWIKECGAVVKEAAVLQVGCGSSSLADELWAQGFKNIVNVDFSEVAINNAKLKYSETHPELKWLLMDVKGSKLRQHFGVSRFDFVVDKGFLDAFVSGGVSENVEEGLEYLESVANVLKPGGKLCIITLGQRHVMKTLLRFLFKRFWKLSVYPFKIQRRDCNSTGVVDVKAAGLTWLHPFFMCIHKPYDAPAGVKNIPKRLTFDWHPPSESSRPAECKPAEDTPLGQLLDKIHECHRWWAIESSLGTAIPGRRIIIDMCTKGAGSSTNIPKYSVVVYDFYWDPAVERRRVFDKENAAIVVPVYVRSGWMFATAEGNQKLAEQVGTRRLLLVFSSVAHDSAFGGGFWKDAESIEDLKTEITPTLARLAVKPIPKKRKAGDTTKRVQKAAAKFPIMAVASGEDPLGSRRVVCEKHSKLTGKIIVYDIITNNEEADATPGKSTDTGGPTTEHRSFRRVMVFASNYFLSQSELEFVVGTTGSLLPLPLENSNSYCYAILTSLALRVLLHRSLQVSTIDTTATGAAATLTATSAAATLAATSAAATLTATTPSSSTSTTTSDARCNVDVLGLGGGIVPSMIMEMAASVCGGFGLLFGSSTDLTLNCVELDPVVAKIAQEHFALAHYAKASDKVNLNVVLSEALLYLTETKDVQSDVIILDIDSGLKDSTDSHFTPPCAGPALNSTSAVEPTTEDVVECSDDLLKYASAFSCPPVTFLMEDSIHRIKAKLNKLHGVFIANVVCRSSAAHKLLRSRLERSFTRVYKFTADEDVNSIYCCMMGGGDDDDTNADSPAVQARLVTLFNETLAYNEVSKKLCTSLTNAAECLRDVEV